MRRASWLSILLKGFATSVATVCVTVYTAFDGRFDLIPKTLVAEDGTGAGGRTDGLKGVRVEMRGEQFAVGGVARCGGGAKRPIKRMRCDQFIDAPERVGRVTRPAIAGWVLNHDGADRVELDITGTGEQVAFRVDERRFVSPFPQGAGAPVAVVDVAHVTTAGGLHQARNALDVARRDQQMHVVGHEDVSMDGTAVTTARLEERVVQIRVVVVREEDGSAVVATLDEVQRHVGQYQTGQSGHRQSSVAEWNSS